MSTSRRKPTQDDVRGQGLCGHGFNYGGTGGMPRYCGKPSEPGATFGDCPAHAREFRAFSRKIDLAATRVAEVGPRVMHAEFEEQRDPQGAVAARGRAAQDPRTRPRTRGRSR